MDASSLGGDSGVVVAVGCLVVDGVVVGAVVDGVVGGVVVLDAVVVVVLDGVVVVDGVGTSTSSSAEGSPAATTPVVQTRSWSTA